MPLSTEPTRHAILIVHGRLVDPIYGRRVDTPEVAALVMMVYYGGMHAIYLLLAGATIVLSLAMNGQTTKAMTRLPAPPAIAEEPGIGIG